MRHYLRMLFAMIMLASGVSAQAQQIDYNPAKVSDSLRAIFQYRLGLNQEGAERQYGHAAYRYDRRHLCAVRCRPRFHSRRRR